MMRQRIIIQYGFVLITLIFSSCSFLKDLTTLGKCEFRITTLENPELAGIDVSDIRSFSDLDFAEMTIITASLMKGVMPLEFTLNIEARNPNPVPAAMNKLAYMAYIDEVEVASGELVKKIEIPANGGVTSIPLRLHTDLLALLENDSRQALINFGLNLADVGDKPTRVSLKVKPVILIAGKEIVYPGYFTVNYDFSSGEKE